MSTILYFIGIIVAIISIICSCVVKSRFNEWAKKHNAQGINGCSAAEFILNQAGVYGVSVVRMENAGALDNYYDPKTRSVNLSAAVYDNPSIAAVAVAAHECGHAIQHNEEYTPLVFRNTLAPVASLGTSLAPVLFFIGIFIVYLFESTAMMWLIDLGIIAYSLAVIFYFVTLPVEFNASNRALGILQNSNILYEDEMKGAKKVLSAAAMTYVAAAAAAAIQLLRMIAIRNND